VLLLVWLNLYQIFLFQFYLGEVQIYGSSLVLYTSDISGPYPRKYVELFNVHKLGLSKCIESRVYAQFSDECRAF